MDIYFYSIKNVGNKNETSSNPIKLNYFFLSKIILYLLFGIEFSCKRWKIENIFSGIHIAFQLRNKRSYLEIENTCSGHNGSIFLILEFIVYIFYLQDGYSFPWLAYD